MSIEPEDLLEDALRSDLPSPATEARLRRRLLGAGIAVGNGIVATTAAAGSAGAAAKVATLSWGLKVGLAAAVAIPSVGMLWEHSQHTPAASTATAPVAVLAPATSQVAPVVVAQPAPASNRVEEPVLEAPRPAPRREEPSRVLQAAPSPAAPSQSAFSTLEPEATPRAGTTLSEETRLLDRAFAALAAGNANAAATLVAEHEARYPQGLLLKERERAKVRLSELSRGE